jgi:hypothetical protein
MKAPSFANSWRLLALISAALLLPPLVPAIALPFLTPLLVPDSSHPSFNPAEMLFFYVAALSASIAFAMPLFLVLRRLKFVRWWTACIVGAIIGGGIALALGGPSAFERAVPAWAATGVLAALVFWLVASVGADSHEV